jgi:hydrogenase expression/formation protein HypC
MAHNEILNLFHTRGFMCLAVPGKILNIENSGPLSAGGRVDFGGIVKQISLAYVPEAKSGDYVLVHAGFAISVIDEEQAAEIFRFLDLMDSGEETVADGRK